MKLKEVLNLVNKEELLKNEAIFWGAFREYQDRHHDKNILLFLTDLFDAGMQERASLFGKRVECKKYLCDVDQIDSDGIYVFNVKTDIVDLEGNLILKNIETKFTIPIDKINKDKAKKLFKLMIVLGLNGYLVNPIEKDKFIKLNNESINSNIKLQYECTECKKFFDSSKKLLDHLKLSKHKDNIFEQYGYWENEFEKYKMN